MNDRYFEKIQAQVAQVQKDIDAENQAKQKERDQVAQYLEIVRLK